MLVTELFSVKYKSRLQKIHTKCGLHKLVCPSQSLIRVPTQTENLEKWEGIFQSGNFVSPEK